MIPRSNFMEAHIVHDCQRNQVLHLLYPSLEQTFTDIHSFQHTFHLEKFAKGGH